MDHNYFQEQAGLPISSHRGDILKFYSNKISSEYSIIINSGNNKAIEKWNWLIDELERKLKYEESWKDFCDSFDDLFNLKNNWSDIISKTFSNL